MREAELADGTILEFPDETPDAVIQAAVKKLVSGQPEKPGFIENTKADAMKREAQTREIDARQAAGIQSDASSFLQKAGVGAGFMADTVGNAVSAIDDLAVKNEKYLPLPLRIGANPEYRKQLSNIAGRSLENPYVSGAIQKTGNYVKGLEERNPAEFNNLAAVLNIGGVMSPSTLVKPTPKGLTGIAGDVIGNVADNQVANRTKKVAAKLVEPKETPTVKAEQAYRTEITRFGTKKVIPEKQEVDAAAEISKIKGLEGKFLQKDFNKIKEVLGQEADALEATLKENKSNLGQNYFNINTGKPEGTLITNALDKARQAIKADISISGDSSGDAAQKIVDRAMQLIDEGDKTPLGLLKARRKLDDEAFSVMGKTAFDNVSNARSQAVKHTRQAINDLIAESVPDEAVKKSLKRQFDMLYAMDNIAPKSAEQANTAIGRFVQSVGRATGAKNKLSQTAALAAGTSVGAAAAYAVPPIMGLAAAGYLTYQGTKIVISPTAKKALAISLKKSDQALRAVEGTDAYQSIKKDRAFVLDLLQNMREDEATK